MAKYIIAELAYNLARKSDCYSDFRRSMADLTSLKELLEDTPAADVVEVVRCKDCNYYKKGFAGEHSNYCDCHSVTFDKFFCKPNDFCSCGERKSDNA